MTYWDPVLQKRKEEEKHMKKTTGIYSTRIHDKHTGKWHLMETFPFFSLVFSKYFCNKEKPFLKCPCADEMHKNRILIQSETKHLSCRHSLRWVSRSERTWVSEACFTGFAPLLRKKQILKSKNKHFSSQLINPRNYLMREQKRLVKSIKRCRWLGKHSSWNQKGTWFSHLNSSRV